MIMPESIWKRVASLPRSVTVMGIDEVRYYPGYVLTNRACGVVGIIRVDESKFGPAGFVPIHISSGLQFGFARRRLRDAKEYVVAFLDACIEEGIHIDTYTNVNDLRIAVSHVPGLQRFKTDSLNRSRTRAVL